MPAARCSHSRAGHRSDQDLISIPSLPAVCASLSRRQNSWWKCRRSSPILLCCSGLWSRTSLLQFLVVGETSVFKVFLPDSSTAQLASQERSSERIVEQIVDSRVLGGGLQDFRPVQGSAASSSSSREHAGEGFFRTLPRVLRSPKSSPHSGSELSADFNPSTLSAYQVAPSSSTLLWSQDEGTQMVDDNGHAWVRLATAWGSFWQNLDTWHTQWRPPWEH